jgi:homoserine kinase
MTTALSVPSSARGANGSGAGRNLRWVAASAPASSANLGCAFDCAAFAIDLRLRARAVLNNDARFIVKYRGPHPDRVPEDDSNLVVGAMKRMAAVRRAELAGADIEIESEIPVGVGLGSSAAATIAGLLLGAALTGAAVDRGELLSLAAEIEGHPDNAGAACHGGIVFAADSAAHRILFARTLLPQNLRLIAIVPEMSVSTRSSRAALPREYSRADVVHNLQRACLLAALCFSGGGSGAADFDPELFRDRIHQPHRVPLVPGLAECLEVRHPDLLGVCLSGSGSSALAFIRAPGAKASSAEKEIGRLLAAPFSAHGATPQILPLRPDVDGARIEAPAAPAEPPRRKSAAHAAAATGGRACKS